MTQSDTQIAGSAPGAGATPAPTETATTPSTEPQNRSADELVEEDLLVEDVSIDGMCGVY
jgi:mycofactocin precursor